VRFTFRTTHTSLAACDALADPALSSRVRNCCARLKFAQSFLLRMSYHRALLRGTPRTCGNTGVCHLQYACRPCVVTTVACWGGYLLLRHHFMYQVTEIHR
jgi:hypothetical protein